MVPGEMAGGQVLAGHSRRVPGATVTRVLPVAEVRAVLATSTAPYDGATDVAVDRTLDAGDGAADSGDASVADGSDAKSDAAMAEMEAMGIAAPRRSRAAAYVSPRVIRCSVARTRVARRVTWCWPQRVRRPMVGSPKQEMQGTGMPAAGHRFAPARALPGYEDLDGLASNGCETKTPALIQMSNLQLWLRADRDMNCATDAARPISRYWKDQSGKGHDAITPVTSTPGGAKPQCVDAATGIHGLPVSASSQRRFHQRRRNAGGDCRIWRGPTTPYSSSNVTPTSSRAKRELLGTSAPGTDCTVTSNVQKAFRFGYRSNTELTVGQLCGGDLVATVAGADVARTSLSRSTSDGSARPPLPAGIASSRGSRRPRRRHVRTPRSPGAPIVAGLREQRGYPIPGDVGEVVVYTAALSDAEPK